MIRSLIAAIVVVLCSHDLGVIAPVTPRVSGAGSISRSSSMNSLSRLSLSRPVSGSLFAGRPMSGIAFATIPRPAINPALSNSAAKTASLMQAQQAAKTVQRSPSVLGRTSMAGNANPNAVGRPGSHRSEASDMPLLQHQQQVQQAPRFSGFRGVSLNRVLGVAGVVLPAASIPAILVPTIMQSKENAERQKLNDARYQNDTAEDLRRYNEQREEQMRQAEEQLRVQNETLIQSKKQFDESMAEQRRQSEQLLTQSQLLVDPSAAASVPTAPAPASIAAAPATVPVALSDRTFETSQVAQPPPPTTGSVGTSGIFW